MKFGMIDLIKAPVEDYEGLDITQISQMPSDLPKSIQSKKLS